MLTLFGKPSRFCDGVSRRNFVKIGALGFGLGGLTLPQLLRAEAAQGIRRSHKSVIMIFLPGGPSHQDMFDLKPDAPAEVRGEFSPIPTNVPGVEICELMPRLARTMDKAVVIRSLVGSAGDHSSFQCLTGHAKKQMPPGGWPAMGSVVSKLQGSADASIPPYVALSGQSSRSEGAHGFLGIAHAPFSPSGEGKRDMTLNGVTLDRLSDRKALLNGLDRFRRDTDNTGAMGGVDSFNQQAMEVLTSSRLVEALDVKKEDPRTLERYGKGDPKMGSGSSRSVESFLVARRLIEAGARCVSLAWGGWDTHSDNFKSMRDRLPALDLGLAALIQDLHERGLDKDVSVVVWGEFGRTPKVNKSAGRDHWPRVSCALLAGGGMKVGKVIGATDRQAGEPIDRAVHFGEVFATLYHNLGIDVSKVTLPDLAGRPQYLAEGYQPLHELV
jgi:hypothetical protein